MFITDTGPLRDALTLAQRVTKNADRRVPALRYALISAAGRLGMTATSLEQRLELTVDGEGTLPPSLLPIAPTLALLRNLRRDDPVAIEVGEAGLGIGTEHNQTTLHTLPVEDYPESIGTPMRDPVSFPMPAADLARLLRAPLHCASTEETRYYLNGVYLQADAAANALHAIATDGHRLMTTHAPLPVGAAALPGAIVPITAARLLADMLADLPAGATVTLYAWGLMLLASVETGGARWSLRTKLIDGTFPDWRRVVPARERYEGDAVLEVCAPRALLAQIGAVTASSREAIRPVVFANGNGSALRLRHAGAAGSAEAEVPAEVARWDGHPRPIGFQARHLRDLCTALPNGFHLRVRAPNEPARADAPEGTYALMPMRV